jgi:hypothetical protein
MGVVYRGKFCFKCGDVFDVSEHACFEQETFKPSIAVSVPFKPGWFHAIGGYANSKRELYETAARKGRTLAKDQLP